MRFIICVLIAMLLGGCQTGQMGTPSTSSTQHAGEAHSDHVDDDEHGEEREGFVVLAEAQIKELDLKTAPVVGASGQSTGLRPGRIEADPDGKVIISSQVSGTLQRFYVQVGGRVRAGDLVALVTSPDVTSLQAGYHEAEVEAELAGKELANKRQLIKVGDDIQRPIESARLELAQAKAKMAGAKAKLKSAVLKNERLETLLKEGIASKQQAEESRADRKALEAELEQAETSVKIAQLHLKREGRVASSELRQKAETFPAEARLARATEQMGHAKERLQQLGASPHGHDGTVILNSPIDGVVVERSSTRGELVSPGGVIALIVDPSKVWVWVELQRSDLEVIDRGDPIELSMVENPAVTEKGFLDYLAPEVDEKTQTVRARVVLRNPRKEFRLGSFVNARVSNGEGKKLPSVPSKSVQSVEGKTIVYVREGTGFRRTPVVLGSSTGEGLVVAMGLKLGDEVVVDGAEQLKSLDLSENIGGHSH